MSRCRGVVAVFTPRRTSRPPPALSAPALVVVALAASALLLTVGCASTGTTSDSDLVAALQDAGVEPRQVIVPFALSDELRAWLAAAQLPGEGSPHQRLRELLELLTGEEGLGIEYSSYSTGTAAEVFARRQANCLGFMNLYVGLAREMGLPVFFAAVDDVQSYDREGDLVVVADHVAAGYGRGSVMLLLDFTGGPDVEFEQVRPLSDLAAVARFYSNRGAEQLIAGHPGAAIPWLEMAVRLEPSLAIAWVNLGVALRRTGDAEGAERAYSRALEEDAWLPSAYQNLAALLRVQGHHREAFELLALTDHLANRNPYNYLVLGDWSLGNGRLGEARRLYRRAVSLLADDAEPYAALGKLEVVAGRPRRARRWLKRAEALDPGESRTVELRSLLSGGNA